MPYLQVDPSSFDVSRLAPAVEHLRRGLIVAFPTDTYYGLAVDPTSAAAVAALFTLKGRSADAAIPLVAGSRAQVTEVFGPLGSAEDRLATRYWPGPLSLLLDAPARTDRVVHGGTGSVAVRVPDQAIARALALAFGGVITATSANLTGAPPARSAADLGALEARGPVFVVDGGSTPGGEPSTIVDARRTPVRLVRPGAIAWDRVLESLEA